MAKDDGKDKDEKEKDDDFQDIEVVVEDEPAPRREKRAEGEGEGEVEADEDERRAKSGGESREAKDDADDEGLSQEERDKRKRRREERQLRKQRRDEERRELAELRQEVAQLKHGQTQTERRVLSTEYRRVEAALQESNRQMEEAQRLIDEAKYKENWAALDDAREAYVEARERVHSLHNMKQRYLQQARRHDGGGEDDQGAPDPEVERRAREWRSQNEWYDVNRRNADSKIAAAIDEQLVEDGYDPRTDRYWKELSRRVAAQLPHRVKSRADADDLDEGLDDEGSQTSGSGRERAPAGKRIYRISRERLAALKEAGVDVTSKKEMAPYIRRFQEWDKKNIHLLKS